MEALKVHNLLFVIFSLLCSTSHFMVSNSSKVIKGAYWPSWTVDFPPSAIDTTLFTHIYYAFLSPGNVTFKFEIDYPTAMLLLNFTSTLHTMNPEVKTFFSIGGASDGATYFVPMASSSYYRKNFILSSIEVARKFGFDGIDLDWEFPPTPKDMDNFGLLLHEWRAEVMKEAHATKRPQLLLSAATYFSPHFFLSNIYRKFPIDSINENLDWVNAMCYDYHGAWEPLTTGAHAALYDKNSNITTSYGLRSWVEAGIKREKLIMGLPLYGKSWELKDPNSSYIGAPAVGVGPGNLGILKYFAIVKLNNENNATVVFDLSTVSTYSVAGSTWIGYDDERSTAVKIGFAQGLGIRGYFFWDVDQDHDWIISQTASKLWGDP